MNNCLCCVDKLNFSKIINVHSLHFLNSIYCVKKVVKIFNQIFQNSICLYLWTGGMEEGSRGQEEAAQLDLLQLFFFRRPSAPTCGQAC